MLRHNRMTFFFSLTLSRLTNFCASGIRGIICFQGSGTYGTGEVRDTFIGTGGDMGTGISNPSFITSIGNSSLSFWVTSLVYLGLNWFLKFCFKVFFTTFFRWVRQQPVKKLIEFSCEHQIGWWKAWICVRMGGSFCKQWKTFVYSSHQCPCLDYFLKLFWKCQRISPLAHLI